MASSHSSNSSKPIAVYDQMVAEWHAVGRSGSAVRALQQVARRDEGLARLVLGTPDTPPACPTPCDVMEHLRRASGRAQRDEAARLVRVLLREAGADPFICRMLVQALLPGLVTVARKLQWGRGGDWRDGEEFFGELVTTAWLVVQDWAGQDRRYAVLDLLSAIRCRLRRQLFRAKDVASRVAPLDRHDELPAPERTATDLEEMAKILMELHGDVLSPEEVQVLYATHVLGYTIGEMAAVTDQSRRALYARRKAARQTLCA